MIMMFGMVVYSLIVSALSLGCEHAVVQDLELPISQHDGAELRQQDRAGDPDTKIADTNMPAIVGDADLDRSWSVPLN